jgi:protein-tyrosine phosphatase
MEASLAMAEVALDSGTTTMVVTPHANQRGRFENYLTLHLYQQFLALKEALEEEDLPLKLYLGMEIFSSEDMGEKIREKKLIGLNASRYYLIEFGFHEEEEQIAHYLSLVKDAGGVPLIAHAERYSCIKDDPELAAEWRKAGALIQINQGSLLGHFGPNAAMAAEDLLDLGLVTCVASDAHDPRRRSPNMAEVRRLLRASLGERKAKELLEDNPQRILLDQPVPGWGGTAHGR